jgi:hypothetical protein
MTRPIAKGFGQVDTAGLLTSAAFQEIATVKSRVSFSLFGLSGSTGKRADEPRRQSDSSVRPHERDDSSSSIRSKKPAPLVRDEVKGRFVLDTPSPWE